MTTDLHGSCAAIAVLLPAARALLAEPGTGAVGGRVPPSSRSSRPPWDTAAANAVMDAHEGLRRLEASLRLAVTGHTGPRRGGSDASTSAALKAIEALSNAVDVKALEQVARYVDRLCRPIRELPAIDQAERWRAVQATCPYCGFTMLRVQPRAGTVTCLRYGACRDSDGHHPIGHVYVSQLTGDPRVHWADGLVAP